MDQEILEYLDESKIDEDVSYSCDFTSAIQACIVDRETALVSERNKEGVEERHSIRNLLKLV